MVLTRTADASEKGSEQFAKMENGFGALSAWAYAYVLPPWSGAIEPGAPSRADNKPPRPDRRSARLPGGANLDHQTLSPNTLAALSWTMCMISDSGTPANCFSTHSWESGKTPSWCG